MSTLDRVIAVIAKALKTTPEHVGLDDDLRDRYGLDSFQTLELVAAIEKQLGVTLPDEELGSYTTVREIVAVIEYQLARPLAVGDSR